MKKALYIIMVLAATAVACGCQSEETRQRLSREERERLRREDSAALKIGVTPTEDCLPIVAAKELRLFDTLGIDVHLRRYKAMSECRHALTRGVVEGAAIDTTLMALMNASAPQGAGDSAAWLHAGMRTSLSWQFLTAKKARLSRLDQLSDKIIAADSHGESHRMAERVVDSLQRKKSMMVFIVQVEDPQVRLDMLLGGNVDAALLPEPQASKARRQGARHIDISRGKAGEAGVVAFRTKAMQHPDRRRQYGLFVKAVAIARDSIALYGKERYMRMLEW